MSASHNFSAQDIINANMVGIARGLSIAMLELQIVMREILSHPGSGRLYRGGRKEQGSERRRSAPSEPPAVDTGTLRMSVQVVPKKILGTGFMSLVLRGLVAGVENDARIPRWLEEGTSRMLPRPFIAPSLYAVRPRVAKIIELQMKRQIDKLRVRPMS